MTRTTILLPAISLLFAACGEQQAPNHEPAVESPSPADNSRTSLDWAGTYSGTVPCANCEGIATRININDDGTYMLQTQYIGKSDERFVAEGTFAWQDDGNHIVLQGIENGPSIYQVGENHLRQRDLDGKPITGELADRYVLTKEAPVPPAAAEKNKPALVGTYWKLVEVMGKAAIHDEQQVPAHMLLQAEGNRVAGNSGCNSFFATYELDEAKGRIRFSKAGSTMMACSDMSMEDAFHKALAQVYNSTIGEDGRFR